MIKINLIEKKKKFEAPVVLGFDFSDFPLKLVVASIILTRIPLSYFEGYLQDRKVEYGEVVDKLVKEERELKREIRKNKKIADELDKYNEKIEDLKKRGQQVDKILQTRTNPRFLLEKVARLTPEDLWLTLLKVSADKKITLDGSADNYRSIGNFIKSLNETPYFDKSLQLKDSSTKSETVGKKKYQYESFNIEGKIGAFNPFIEENN